MVRRVSRFQENKVLTTDGEGATVGFKTPEGKIETLFLYLK